MNIRVLITWLDALACLATGAAAVAYYGFGISAVDLTVIVVSLVQYGVFIAGIWAVLEVASWIAGQAGNNPLWWLDYVTTWFAWLFINLAALYVWLGVRSDYQPVVHRLEVPYATELLIGLVIFSWFAALVLQAHKHKRVWQEGQTQRQVQPAAPQQPAPPANPAPAPAPASAGGGAVAVAALLLLIVIIVLFAFNGGKVMKVGLSDDKGEVCRETFVGNNKDGIPVYKPNFDC